MQTSHLEPPHAVSCYTKTHVVPFPTHAAPTCHDSQRHQPHTTQSQTHDARPPNPKPNQSNPSLDWCWFGDGLVCVLVWLLVWFCWGVCSSLVLVWCGALLLGLVWGWAVVRRAPEYLQWPDATVRTTAPRKHKQLICFFEIK